MTEPKGAAKNGDCPTLIWFKSKGTRILPFLALIIALLVFLYPSRVDSAPRITGFDSLAGLTWTNSDTPGVVTIEVSSSIHDSWMPAQNAFSTTSTGRLTIAMADTNKFFRLRSVAVPPTAPGFTNLIQAYGLLETLAGDGVGRTDGVNYWQPQFEGGSAAGASLSRPHFAMADRVGNIFIADKNSHSVLRVATNGTIHTHAGTHTGGFNGEGPGAATNLHLNFPNALWVRGDGTVYVLDTDNGRIRRIDTNGMMSTLFVANGGGSSLNGGRMLWVKDDESLAYFGNETRVRRWTPANGVQTLASGFEELGTFHVESGGNLIVADRGGHCVYRVTPAGDKTVIAGNGTTGGGGDGSLALQTGLNGPRGVWPVPTGGYLFLLHDGCQLWYMDSANIMRLLMSGDGGMTHSGDGSFFYDPLQLMISEGRSVAMDYSGNILLCESDYGYVRRIRFTRLSQ